MFAQREVPGSRVSMEWVIKAQSDFMLCRVPIPNSGKKNIIWPINPNKTLGFIDRQPGMVDAVDYQKSKEGNLLIFQATLVFCSSKKRFDVSSFKCFVDIMSTIMSTVFSKMAKWLVFHALMNLLGILKTLLNQALAQIYLHFYPFLFSTKEVLGCLVGCLIKCGLWTFSFSKVIKSASLKTISMAVQ